jgi:hydroxypyruvate reductase
MIVDPRLFHEDTTALRRHAIEILSAAVVAADAGAAVARALRRDGARLQIADAVIDLDSRRRIIVLGAGKAATRMAGAVDAILADRPVIGAVVTKYGHGEPLQRIDVIEAGHPLPDAAGARGAQRVADLARDATADDVVLVVISGGGSALLPLPAPGISLEEKVATTDLLLRSGAAIADVNCVRKHLSRIKGGWLARLAAPAEIVTLVLSDVLGNPLDAIASGPTVPDPTTFRDAMNVVDRFGMKTRLAASVREYLERGLAGAEPDTPKPLDPAFRRSRAVVIGDITTAAAAAVRRASTLGYATWLEATDVEGEARDVGESFAKRLLAAQAGPRSGLPACRIIGGETTVTVRGQGRGGRNQEVALAGAAALAGTADILVAAFGTDGTDGPTDAAGAVVDGTTIARGRARNLEPEASLEQNDAYTFFDALDDLIITGPTHTNVNDLTIGLIGPAPESA